MIHLMLIFHRDTVHQKYVLPLAIFFSTCKVGDLFDCYLTSGGMYDEEVSVAGDEEDGEGGEEDAGRLDRTDQLAQNLLRGKRHNFLAVFNAALQLAMFWPRVQ